MVLVPEVVFGTAQLFGLSDDVVSRQVLDRAWDAGIRRFDTAPSYGASEEVAGRIAREENLTIEQTAYRSFVGGLANMQWVSTGTSTWAGARLAHSDCRKVSTMVSRP